MPASSLLRASTREAGSDGGSDRECYYYIYTFYFFVFSITSLTTTYLVLVPLPAFVLNRIGGKGQEDRLHGVRDSES